MNEQDFYNKLIRADFTQNDPYGALSMPVYHSAAYEFESAEQMELAFTGKSGDFSYSRISNPTVQFFEDKVKAITGAWSVTALNSGMAAISNVFIALAYSGANIVTSRHLFGNTYSFFASTLADFGVEVRFCDMTDISSVESAIDTNTCAVFLEIITNPQMEIADLQALSGLTRKQQVPLIADTTVIPFCAFDAGAWGIDIEVVSSTKYISGGATSLGGLIIDHGTFDWKSSYRLKGLAETQGSNTFTFKLKREIHRNLGAYMTPQVAYMQTLGLDTLELRYKRASETAYIFAEKLQKHPGIKSVNYAGLKNNAYFDLARKQFGVNPGAMFTFDLESQEACFKLMNKLKVIKRATNLFDNKTLAIHPYSTIFGTFSEKDKQAMHVSDCTIRISAGLENPEELYNDIVQAMN